MDASFLKRLGFYMGGLAIGIIILAFFVKGSGASCEFNYFPNARVLKDIRSKQRYFGPEIQQLLDNKVLDTLEISNILKYGDVNFSKSDVNATPCKIYYIDGILKNKDIELLVENCKNKTNIKSIKMLE